MLIQKLKMFYFLESDIYQILMSASVGLYLNCLNSQDIC